MNNSYAINTCTCCITIPSAEKYFDYIMKMVDSNMDAGPRKKKLRHLF